MKNKISFFLNSKKVEANNNETIWDVSKREGLEIPHLCHRNKNGYKPDGNCRACVVEVQGEKTLTASCIRKPTKGMKVSDKLRQRKYDPVLKQHVWFVEKKMPPHSR